MTGTVYKKKDDGAYIPVQRQTVRHELALVSGIKYIPEHAIPASSKNPLPAFLPALEVERYGGSKNTKTDTWYYPLSTIETLENVRCMARGYMGEDE